MNIILCCGILKYIKRTGLRRFLIVICGLVISVTVIGRLLSGVHWLTDIVGGILISATLLSLFSWVVVKFKDEEIWLLAIEQGAVGKH